MDSGKNKSIDYRLVKQLVKLLEDSTLHELKVKLNDTFIHLVKNARQPTLIQSQPTTGGSFLDNVTPPPPMTQPKAEEKKEEATHPGNPVVSPMVGTFYRSPSPDADSFVQEGDQVKEGDVLCIIEAMKMMNHIKAPRAGKIGAILANDSQPVEYGQHLMMILD